MLVNAAQVQAQYAKSVTAPERKEHLLSYEEVVVIHNERVAEANRSTTSHEDMIKGLTSYLVSGALGDALSPRCLKGWTEMKVRAYDTKSPVLAVAATAHQVPAKVDHAVQRDGVAAGQRLR